VTSARSFAAKIIAWSIVCVGAQLTGLIMEALGLPAPWLVGPMLVAVAFALTLPRQRPNVPRAAQQLLRLSSGAFSPRHSARQFCP
jgi:uncharacterized membrane protein AbrB (regulator of aidB expression)